MYKAVGQERAPVELDPQWSGVLRDPYPTHRYSIGLHVLGRAPEQAAQGSSHSPALPSIAMGLLPPLICAKCWKNISRGLAELEKGRTKGGKATAARWMPSSQHPSTSPTAGAVPDPQLPPTFPGGACATGDKPQGALWPHENRDKHARSERVKEPRVLQLPAASTLK